MPNEQVRGTVENALRVQLAIYVDCPVLMGELVVLGEHAAECHAIVGPIHDSDRTRLAQAVRREAACRPATDGFSSVVSGGPWAPPACGRGSIVSRERLLEDQFIQCQIANRRQLGRPAHDSTTIEELTFLMAAYVILESIRSPPRRFKSGAGSVQARTNVTLEKAV